MRDQLHFIASIDDEEACFLSSLLVPIICFFSFSDPVYKVKCSDEQMVVEMIKPLDVKALYLEHLKRYPVDACKPQISGDKATFSLSLKDIFQCMVTKVENKATVNEKFSGRICKQSHATFSFFRVVKSFTTAL